MKNVLIPIDLSDNSINALNYAQALLKNVPVNFYLLGVYISNKSILLGDDYNKEWLNEMDNNVTENIKALAQKHNNKGNLKHSFKAITQASSLLDAIKKAIQEKGIDLIVSGTKGASGLKEIFIGTNTLKFINSINNCPILVIPSNYKFNKLHQVVFSTNYKRGFNSNELKVLINIALIHKAVIEVVQLTEENYLTETQKINKTQLQGYLEDFEFVFNKLDWEGSETETIKNHVENTNSELLALINHKHNFFYKLTEENVIKKASFYSKIPLLILPEISV